MSRALVVGAVLAAGTGVARAEEPASEPPAEVSATRRLAAIGAAIVPGVVVHGAGSWVLREKRAAKRLAVTGWIGLGAMGLGGAAVGISNAAPSMAIWGVPLIIAGAGLALPTWFADIWYAAGGPRVRGRAHAPSPWSIELGTTWLHDAYRERALVRGAGRIELGRIGFGAGALVDAEGRASTTELAGSVRLAGAPATGARGVDDASRIEVHVAGRRQLDEDDALEIATAELAVAGRLDLRRLDRNLDGSFLELVLGIGIERVTYAETTSDHDQLFLGRFAWGLYLGALSELAVFYDHRRDSLAGGIAAGRAAGFVGSVGLQTDLRIAGPFALAAELEIGSAWVTTLGIRYHGGSR